MNNKVKFTATAVNELDKTTIQELRKEFKVTEKVMMAAIIQVAGMHRDELGEVVATLKPAKPVKEETPEVPAKEPTAEETPKQDEVPVAAQKPRKKSKK